MNLDRYAAADFTHHPNIYPFPYGILDAPFGHGRVGRWCFLNAVLAAEDASLQAQQQQHVGLRLGYFDPESRNSVPNGPRQRVAEYYNIFNRVDFFFLLMVIDQNVIVVTIKSLVWEPYPLLSVDTTKSLDVSTLARTCRG